MATIEQVEADPKYAWLGRRWHGPIRTTRTDEAGAILTFRETWYENGSLVEIDGETWPFSLAGFRVPPV